MKEVPLMGSSFNQNLKINIQYELKKEPIKLITKSNTSSNKDFDLKL